jgi:uncharacterized protein YkwD
MNLIDILLCLVILLSVVSGYRRGAILGVLDLVTLVIGLLVAFRFSGYLAKFLEMHAKSLGVWTMPVAFLVCYFIARFVLGALARMLLRGVSPQTHNSTVNKTLGIVPGGVNGVINAAVLSTLLLVLPLSDGLSDQTRDSRLTAALTPYVERAEEAFAPVFEGAINHAMAGMTVHPASTERVDLGYTVQNPRVREDLEDAMLVLVNAERGTVGLHPLKGDTAMRAVARAYAKEMFAKGFFAHISPEGTDPGDRARKMGVRFITLGENLALAPTLKFAHNGLMNSPGHRANILHKSFGRLGIGIVDGGRYGLMVVQEFRN